MQETPEDVVEGEIIDGIERAAPIDEVKSLSQRYTEASRDKMVRQVCNLIREHLDPESACWAAGIDPEELQLEMQGDRQCRLMINQAIARAEVALIRVVKRGGKGLDPAKSALEILKHTKERWKRRANVNLQAQFRDALIELKKRLLGIKEPMSGDQALKIIAARLGALYGLTTVAAEKFLFGAVPPAL